MLFLKHLFQIQKHVNFLYSFKGKINLLLYPSPGASNVIFHRKKLDPGKYPFQERCFCSSSETVQLSEVRTQTYYTTHLRAQVQRLLRTGKRLFTEGK